MFSPLSKTSMKRSEELPPLEEPNTAKKYSWDHDPNAEEEGDLRPPSGEVSSSGEGKTGTDHRKKDRAEEHLSLS